MSRVIVIDYLVFVFAGGCNSIDRQEVPSVTEEGNLSEPQELQGLALLGLVKQYDTITRHSRPIRPPPSHHELPGRCLGGWFPSQEEDAQEHYTQDDAAGCVR